MANEEAQYSHTDSRHTSTHSDEDIAAFEAKHFAFGIVASLCVDGFQFCRIQSRVETMNLSAAASTIIAMHRRAIVASWLAPSHSMGTKTSPLPKSSSTHTIKHAKPIIDAAARQAINRMLLGKSREHIINIVTAIPVIKRMRKRVGGGVSVCAILSTNVDCWQATCGKEGGGNDSCQSDDCCAK